MGLNESRNAEYQKCADILAKLIDLSDCEKDIIIKYFRSNGITKFFLHIESMDLPSVTIEKLKNIKSIVDISNEERGQI